MFWYYTWPFLDAFLRGLDIGKWMIIKSGRRTLRLGIYTGKLPNEVSQYDYTKRVRENKRVLQLKYLAEVLLMWF